MGNFLFMPLLHLKGEMMDKRVETRIKCKTRRSKNKFDGESEDGEEKETMQEANEIKGG
jgi:hypothetical protein